MYTYLYHRHDSSCERWNSGGGGVGAVGRNFRRIQLFASGLVLECNWSHFTTSELRSHGYIYSPDPDVGLNMGRKWNRDDG